MGQSQTLHKGLDEEALGTHSTNEI